MDQFNPNAGISGATLPFITSAWDSVTSTLTEQGEIRQLAVFINRTAGDLMFVPQADVPTKDMFAMMLHMISLAQNNEIPESMPSTLKTLVKTMIESYGGESNLLRPDLVVHMSEAWMVSFDVKNHTPEKLEQIKRAQEGLSGHPDRIEVVIVGWKTSDGETGHQIRKLERDADGAPSLGEYVMNEQIGHVTSRFLDNIFDHATSH
jgi:hypothetical protein